MKITRLFIEHFGLWTELDLPLTAEGLSILCGPNEAGKTTLLRFIRGVLFGFSPSDMQPAQSRSAIFTGNGRRTDHSGSAIRPGGGFLEVIRENGETAGKIIRIERRWDLHGEEQLSVSSTGEETLQPALQIEWLGVGRSVFEHVFALGLPELQQLAVLHRNEVAERCYDISLGPQGRTLLQALRRTESACRKYLRERQTAEGKTSAGELIALSEEAAHLQEERNAHIHLRDRYDQLCRSQQRLLEHIDDLKSRQAGMQEQLRGHHFLERIFEPWKQVEEYRAALNKLPACDPIAPEIVRQLEQLDEEIRSEGRCRHVLREEIRQRQQQLLHLQCQWPSPRVIASLKHCLNRAPVLSALERQLKESKEKLQQYDQELNEVLHQLDSSWSAEQLAGKTFSPESFQELWKAALSFQNTRRRLHRFRKNYHRLSRRQRRAGHELKSALATADGQNAVQCFEAETQALHRHQHHQQLQQRIAELKDRLNHLDRLHSVSEESFVLPAWFRGVLWVFLIAGGLASAAGMVVSATINVLSGAILSLAGLSALGIARGLKYREDMLIQRKKEFLQRERQKLAEELQQRQQEERLLEEEEENGGSVQRNGENEGHPAVEITTNSLETSETLTDEERAAVAQAALMSAVQRCAHWQRLIRLEQRQQQRNRQLVLLRTLFAERQRQYQAARQQWCQTLQKLGLPESLNVAETWQHGQRLFSACEAARRYDSERRRYQRLYLRRQKWLKKLQDAAEAAGIPVTESSGLPALLALCHEKWNQWQQVRQKRRTLKEEMAIRREEVRNCAHRLRTLKDRRRHLLEEAGVSSRAEFEQKAALSARRTELEELLELAEEELREAAETEPELAIVEEDLRQHDPEHNTACIEMLQQELKDLQHDLNRAHEELGRIRQALRELTENRSQSRLHRRWASLSRDFTKAAMNRLVEEGVLTVLDHLRCRYEAEHQPDVLRDASSLLEQLTAGRYPRLWTPLAQRRLLVDDVTGRTWSLEELSGGTREAVFLALRLALVQDYSRRGVHLPMILDDVLVNFDQSRAEAAAETLLQLAGKGQQILFLTCHQHIAELFARRGITPCWLRGPALPASHRRAG